MKYENLTFDCDKRRIGDYIKKNVPNIENIDVAISKAIGRITRDMNDNEIFTDGGLIDMKTFEEYCKKNGGLKKVIA